jgi:hypothetical protein
VHSYEILPFTLSQLTVQSRLSLFNEGFDLFLVAVRCNGDSSPQVSAVDSCPESAEALEHLVGGQTERVAKANGKNCDLGFEPLQERY